LLTRLTRLKRLTKLSCLVSFVGIVSLASLKYKDLTKLGKNQISLSEWFEQIGYAKTAEFRKEDNDKRKNLLKLNQIIGLPFDKPTEFSAEDIANSKDNFLNFLNDHGSELCAYRLIPLDDKLPKLRMRGYSVKKTFNWFNEQKIDSTKYRVDIIPHSDKYTWSTIFIINKNGIFGEIIKGNPFMLTQGFYNEETPITFSFDFKNWLLSTKNPEALDHLKMITKWLKIEDPNKQIEVEQQINGQFCNNYLLGYFETTESPEFGLWFIDWNRILGETYSEYQLTNIDTNYTNKLISGVVAYAGKVRGKVKIVSDYSPLAPLSAERGVTSDPDWILVCKMTTPEYIPLMKECVGIITEQGGILSHAAIIARELKKPCVVGVKNVMSVLRDLDIRN